MTFFYDLNKKLDSIRAKPETTHTQLNERDMSRAAKGYEKYGKQGMEALAKAGREGKALDPIRAKYNKYDNEVDESMAMTDEGNAFLGAVAKAKADGIQPGEKIRVGGKEMPLKEKMSPAKQKSFAKLAPPADKITFADKIAGAKKEVDEMLGDVAAEAMKKALGGGMGRSAEMEEKEDLNPFTNYKKPRADRPKVGSIEHGTLHDIEHTATGRRVTRRVDPNTGHSVGADDDTPQTGEKRGKGRPKGTGKSIGAKGPSGNSKLMKREDEHDVEDQGEYDQEGDMAKDDIKTIVRHAQALSKVLGDNDNLPEWVQSKLAKIEGMMISIDEYMQNQAGDNEEEPIAEKAVSKKQQKFMGMVHATQKGAKPASKEVGKAAKSMGKKDAEDFASTKHKGLPEKKAKKKEESVEENTVAGSVATSSGTANDPGAPKAKKSGGSMSFGQGVYEGAIAESFNKKLGAVLTEGMNVNMSTDSEGHQSLTVTATDEDAAALADMLKMAGLGQNESCSSCGQSPCGCDHIDEELANSPNTEYSNTDTMVNTLSGGLNGRKSTGQTVLAPVNSQTSRQGPMSESNEKRLWELYNRYETK